MVFFIEFLQCDTRRGMLFLAGLFTGLAVATKITAFVAVGWLLLLAVAYIGVAGLQKNLRLAFVFAAGAFGPLLLFAAGRREFLSHSTPFLTSFDHTPRRRLILIHSGDIVKWITAYDSLYFTLFCGVVIALAILHRSRLKNALLLSFLYSCAAYAALLAVVFPRYLVPHTASNGYARRNCNR